MTDSWLQRNDDTPEGWVKVATPTPLSDEAKAAFRNIFTVTPVIALPHGGMTRAAAAPQTVEDVLKNVEAIVSAVKYYMDRAEKAETELTSIKLDLRAAGRVFDLMKEDVDA